VSAQDYTSASSGQGCGFHVWGRHRKGVPMITVLSSPLLRLACCSGGRNEPLIERGVWWHHWAQVRVLPQGSSRQPAT
jgi:hypothetical protein